MEIKKLLEISSELRDSIRTYISETTDQAEIIVRRGLSFRHGFHRLTQHFFKNF